MKQVASWSNKHFAGSIGYVGFDKEELEPIIPKYDYAHSFAYLWRRFGPPIHGWDDYKELVLYLLTTKMKGVYLLCNCYLHSAEIAFGVGFSNEIYEKILSPFDPEHPSIPDCNKQKKDWPDYLKEIWQVLLDAVEELKRPVNIRDWYINIEGPVDYKDVRNPVPYSKRAGYGISPDYFKKFQEKRLSHERDLCPASRETKKK